MERLPCRMAHALMVTLPPMTTVPVFSLTTTLAGGLVWTGSSPTVARSAGIATRGLQVGNFDAAAVDDAGKFSPEFVVNDGSGLLGGFEVGVAQENFDRVHLAEIEGSITFDEGAVGNAAGGGMIHDFGIRGGTRAVAADDQGSLGGGVNFSVGGAEWGEQERAAGQTFGVADGGDGNVDLHAWAGKGGKRGGNENGGDVADLNGQELVLDVNAGTLQHVGKSLHGEKSLLLVARAIEADDQAVTDELVVADTFEVADVFKAGEARGTGGSIVHRASKRRKQWHDEEKQQCGEFSEHEHPPRTTVA